MGKIEQNSLPSIEKLYGSLNLKNIFNSDYSRANKGLNIFEVKSVADCRYLYV